SGEPSHRVLFRQLNPTNSAKFLCPPLGRSPHAYGRLLGCRHRYELEIGAGILRRSATSSFKYRALRDRNFYSFISVRPEGQLTPMEETSDGLESCRRKLEAIAGWSEREMGKAH